MIEQNKVESGSTCPFILAANVKSPTSPFIRSIVAFRPSAYSKR